MERKGNERVSGKRLLPVRLSIMTNDTEVYRNDGSSWHGSSQLLIVSRKARVDIMIFVFILFF
jgi:hypothetical protein